LPDAILTATGHIFFSDCSPCKDLAVVPINLNVLSFRIAIHANPQKKPPFYTADTPAAYWSFISYERLLLLTSLPHGFNIFLFNQEPDQPGTVQKFNLHSSG
jgi:hypothetical protein